MSRDLNDLVPQFRTEVEKMLQRCSASGYRMRPFFTLRSPFEQGRLWRQSRTTRQINAKTAALTEGGAPFLADCIDSVGPQSGRHVTNAVPGLSWHQCGEAVDCFWLVDGSAEWSTRRKIDGLNGYGNYGRLARETGLEAGGFWSSFRDWPHVQMRSEGNPGRV